MKLLVVGIDGASRELVEQLPMPFMQELLAKSHQKVLTEDLWSRGWAEIVSGAHGSETGAFYHRPAEQGTHQFTQSYRKADFANSQKARPLWELLDAKGIRSGFMNIPTTFPAPQNNGFFVSGAGSGVGGSGSVHVPSNATHPVDVEKCLRDSGYIFDYRLQSSGEVSLSRFIHKQLEMTRNRTKAFLVCCRQHDPKFGFIAYMMTKYIFNMGMYDLRQYFKSGVGAGADAEAIALSFSTLDDCIKELFDELKPERYILTSDHGTVPYLHRIDANVFLRKCGFQSGRQGQSLKYTVRQFIRALLPKSARGKLKQRLPNVAKVASTTHGIGLDKSQAFAARYVPGIYINDERFGGPVEKGQADRLTEEICEAFNAMPEANEYDLKARPYRGECNEAQFGWMLPDIWIDHPDTMFFEHGIGEGFPSGDRLISENADYGPLPTLDKVTRDLWTGIKGRHPLFAVDQSTVSLIEEGDPDDLRLVHRLVERSFA